MYNISFKHKALVVLLRMIQIELISLNVFTLICTKLSVCQNRSFYAQVKLFFEITEYLQNTNFFLNTFKITFLLIYITFI